MTKRLLPEFLRRGVSACGFGPLALAVLDWLLARQGVLQTLTVREVCLGIVSLTGLAFMAGGLNIVYQIERLPLMAAVTIHGVVLYLCYLATYLVNNWLERDLSALLVFTAIFVLGYLAIWAVIYAIIRRRTENLNRILKEKQNHTTP